MSVLRAVMMPPNAGYDPLERLELAQSRHVGGRGIGRRFLRCGVARLFIGVLLGDRLGGKQSLPTRIGGVGQGLRWHRGRKICLSLAQLLSTSAFRFLQQIAPWSPPFDIGAPILEIAAGARVNGAQCKPGRCLKHQLLPQRRCDWV